MSEVMVELVCRGDAYYRSVTEVAEKVYKEILGLKPLELPSCFVEIFHNNEPVGGAGLNHADEHSGPLWVEAFSYVEESAKERVEDFLRINESVSRSSWSEITCFHVVSEFRQFLVIPVLIYTFLYVEGVGRKTTLNIQAGTLDRSLRQIGIKFEKFRYLGKDFPVAAPKAFRNAFIDNYVGRTRPHCSGINVAQATEAARKYLKNHPELRIIIGPKLRDYLKPMS